jgi:hypothetical protein
MAVAIKNLADLKRLLAQPGAQVIGLDHFLSAARPEFMRVFRSWRVVAKLQGHDVALAANADEPRGKWTWLDFGKASDWSFDGSDQAVKLVGGDPAKRISYRFFVPQA